MFCSQRKKKKGEEEEEEEGEEEENQLWYFPSKYNCCCCCCSSNIKKASDLQRPLNVFSTTRLDSPPGGGVECAPLRSAGIHRKYSNSSIRFKVNTFFSILLIHEGSHREVYQENSNPVMTSSAGPVPRVVQTTGSLHPRPTLPPNC